VHAAFGACAREELRPIGTRHQQAAALMAAAHNYVSGKLSAVALVSSGVAASNALTGTIVARDNGWPLIVLAGAAPQEPRDYGHFTALDVEPLFRPVTKASMTLSRTSDIAEAIREAFAVAMTGRPGPVMLQLPADVLNGPTLPSAASIACPAPTKPIDRRSLDEAARWLRAAARPLVILGKGARWNDGYVDVQALVDTLRLPFVTSPIARGYLSDDHPECLTAVTWDAQRDADVILLLGARFDWTFRHGTQIAPDALLIQVDVHEAELGRNRRADLAIHGDIRVFVRGLLERWPAAVKEAAADRRDMNWINTLQRRRRSVIARRQAECTIAGDSIAPAQLARAIGRALPPGAITVLDGNLILAECQRHITVHDAVSRLTPGNSGCMGTGIPFAIGAKLASPKRTVVAVCGDFAFGLNAFEMETAVRHKIPIIVVVANNDGHGGAAREREMFRDGHAERVSMFGAGLRYSELMRTFGGFGEHVDSLKALDSALARAITADTPACINVALDQHAAYPSEQPL